MYITHILWVTSVATHAVTNILHGHIIAFVENVKWKHKLRFQSCFCRALWCRFTFQPWNPAHCLRCFGYRHCFMWCIVAFSVHLFFSYKNLCLVPQFQFSDIMRRVLEILEGWYQMQYVCTVQVMSQCIMGIVWNLLGSSEYKSIDSLWEMLFLLLLLCWSWMPPSPSSALIHVTLTPSTVRPLT